MSSFQLSLESLGTEILASIFEFVDDSSPRTTKSLLLVNKLISATTKLVSHRHKILEFQLNNDLERTGILQDKQALQGIRYLTIVSPRRSPEDGIVRPLENRNEDSDVSYEDNKPLAELIQKLSNLKKLKWSLPTPISLGVLQALHEFHPKAKLELDKFNRSSPDMDHADPAEIELSHSPALSSIRASIFYNDILGVSDLREAAFKRIVANAPNLKHASIVMSGQADMIRGLSQSARQDYENQCSKFLTHTKPNSSLRSLTLDGYGLSKATLTEWSKFVDFSKLESVKCSRGNSDVQFYREAPQTFNNIKHLSLNLAGRVSQGDEISAAMVDYIENCPPLESLSLWSWMGVVSLDALLSRHGNTLRTLQLHEREVCQKNSRMILTSSQVAQIRQQCPKLKNFTFDMERDLGGLQQEISQMAGRDTLEELSKFDLNELQIYLDLGVFQVAVEEEEADAQGEPLETLSGPSSYEDIHNYVVAIWKVIFGSKPTGPRELDVKVGEWEKKIPWAAPMRWLQYETQKRSLWNVRPHERDDQSGECMVKAWRKTPDLRRMHYTEYGTVHILQRMEDDLERIRQQVRNVS